MSMFRFREEILQFLNAVIYTVSVPLNMTQKASDKLQETSGATVNFLNCNGTMQVSKQVIKMGLMLIYNKTTITACLQTS